jgi:hypothetical protein
MTLFIGIDPGVGGGVAWINQDGLATTQPMPGDLSALSTTLRNLTKLEEELLVVVEQVGGFINAQAYSKGPYSKGPQANVAAAHTMFKLGVSYGEVRGLLTGLCVDYEKVVPQTWQKAVGAVKRKGCSRDEWKRYLRDLARGLYPGVGVTLKTGDALLIAHYCRLRYG